MLDAARLTVTLTGTRKPEDLQADIQFALALVKCLETIGEAAANLPAGFRQDHPEIPWKEIVAMRNRLIHGYFEIKYERVWHTATVDVPKLIADLELLLHPPKR